MEYLKINSLWQREQFVKGMPKGTHGKLLPGEYSDPAFGNIKEWAVEEKIDGTNIRITWTPFDGVKVQGRTNDAQIPPHLLEYLQANFQSELIASALNIEPGVEGRFPVGVVLFGEGYGPKIQSGGNYRSDVSFCLFDVFCGGWWLKREDVRAIAEKLSINAPPDLGIRTEEAIIDFVKSKPLSRCSIVPQMMEGIVARSHPLMLLRNGNPVMFKLKCKEFI